MPRNLLPAVLMMIVGLARTGGVLLAQGGPADGAPDHPAPDPGTPGDLAPDPDTTDPSQVPPVTALDLAGVPDFVGLTVTTATNPGGVEISVPSFLTDFVADYLTTAFGAGSVQAPELPDAAGDNGPPA